MAAVPITIDGVLFDKYGRTTQLVRLMGEATITGLGVGGGPIYPPGNGDKPPGQPPGIWGGPIDPYPDHGLPQPPQRPLPPDVTPPQPGEPPILMPPPAGSAGWPVNPIAPPPYIVVNYPGVGPIIVAPPAPSA